MSGNTPNTAPENQESSWEGQEVPLTAAQLEQARLKTEAELLKGPDMLMDGLESGVGTDLDKGTDKDKTPSTDTDLVADAKPEQQGLFDKLLSGVFSASDKVSKWFTGTFDKIKKMFGLNVDKAKKEAGKVINEVKQNIEGLFPDAPVFDFPKFDLSGKPINAYVSSIFGPRWGRFHGGTDVAGVPRGTPILARQKCTVIVSKPSSGGGNMVYVRLLSNGKIAKFMHADEPGPKVGTELNPGDIICKVGNTGHIVSTKPLSDPDRGTHLHYEICDANGKAQEPDATGLPAELLAQAEEKKKERDAKASAHIA